MHPLTIALVLFAALLHAAWNAVLRGGGDRFWSINVICLASSGVAFLALPFLPPPRPESWPFILVSGLIHIGYNLSLVRSYKSGDLGEIYPVARGSSPLLVALGAALFAGEHLSALALASVALISFGIIVMAFHKHRMCGANLVAALTTGLCIAAYSVVDGMGVRRAGDAFSYTAAMSAVSLAMPLIFLARRGARAFAAPVKDWSFALLGGVLSLVAYGIVIFAMQRGAMGMVSALRETSVVFAALIGWFYLGERLTWRRMAACLVIAAGAAGLGYTNS